MLFSLARLVYSGADTSGAFPFSTLTLLLSGTVEHLLALPPPPKKGLARSWTPRIRNRCYAFGRILWFSLWVKGRIR